jgi:hypothetical protein
MYAIIAFAQFLPERRQVAREAASKDELAEVEHTRILRVLDAAEPTTLGDDGLHA